MTLSVRPSRGFIFTFLSALSWAINIVIARVLLSRGETAGNLAFWQTLFTIPYWMLLFYQNKEKTKNLRPKLWVLLLVMGLVNMIGVVLNRSKIGGARFMFTNLWDAKLEDVVGSERARYLETAIMSGQQRSYLARLIKTSGDP